MMGNFYTLLAIISIICRSVACIERHASAHRFAIDCYTSCATIPSLPVTAVSSNAIITAFQALVTLVETFIAQLLDAPSQIIPLTSPIILPIAMAIVW